MESRNSELLELPQVNFIREGVKIGLINGAIALLIMYVSYFMGLDAFVDAQFMSQFIPYMIIILIIYGLQLRKRNGGYLSFRDGLQFTFMSYVIAALMIAIGTYILFNLIDKDLTQKAFDLSVEKTRKMFESLNLNEGDLEREMEKLENKKPQETGFKNIFLGFGMDLVWHFIKSLLITLIIRKEKPAMQ